MTNKTQKGFTLIELLVVIAIIGILASIVIVGLNDARKRGRDGRRVADMKSLQNALELYYETNTISPKSYPAGMNYLNSATAINGYCSISVSLGVGLSWTVLGNQLVPTYFQSMPIDPKNTDTNPANYATRCSAATNTNLYMYMYWTDLGVNPTKYRLVTRTEGSVVGNSSNPLTFISSPEETTSRTRCGTWGNYYLQGGKW